MIVTPATRLSTSINQSPISQNSPQRISTQALECGDKAFKILALCTVFWHEPKATIAGVLIGAATHLIDVQKGPLKSFADMAAFCLDPRTALETQPLLSQQNNATHVDRNIRAYRTASICRTAVATALAISAPSHGIIPFSIGWLASKNSLQFTSA